MMASEHGVSHAPCDHQTTDGSRSWTNCRNWAGLDFSAGDAVDRPVSLADQSVFSTWPSGTSPRWCLVGKCSSAIQRYPRRLPHRSAECQQRQNGSAVPPFSSILLPGLGVVWVGTYLPLQCFRCSVTHCQNKAARGPISHLRLFFKFGHMAVAPADSGPTPWDIGIPVVRRHSGPGPTRWPPGLLREVLPFGKMVADLTTAEAPSRRPCQVLVPCGMGCSRIDTIRHTSVPTSGHLLYTITARSAMRNLESNWMSVCLRILGGITWLAVQSRVARLRFP